MLRRHARYLIVLAAFPLFALAVAPLGAQHGSDSREACRRAASALVNQEARWDDQRGRGSSGSLNWRAADGTYGTCSIDNRGRVYNVRVERWGTTSGGIDVWPGQDGPVRTLRCESERDRLRECEIPRGAGVRLITRLSDSPCIQGRTWGYNRNLIWVDNGCRAVFEVRP
jgi:hypothetical protein